MLCIFVYVFLSHYLAKTFATAGAREHHISVITNQNFRQFSCFCQFLLTVTEVNLPVDLLVALCGAHSAAPLILEVLS